MAHPSESSLLRKWLGWFGEPVRRERDRILAELTSCQGLMPLLMQQRNGRPWTAEERSQLLQHLRRLSSLGPYLFLLLAPGSFLSLPVLAWWLDRRRKRRSERTQSEERRKLC